MARPFVFLGSFSLCVPRCISNVVPPPLFPLSEVDKQVKVNLTPQCDGRPPVTSSHKHNFSNNPHSSSQGHSANQRTETCISSLHSCPLLILGPTFSLSNNSPLICQSLHLDNSFPLIFFYFRLRRIFGVQTLLLNAYSTIVQSKYIKQQVVSIYSSAFPIFNFIK